MRNIRLYIGGQRADLDSGVKIPFTYQTSDSQQPTAVKNSYSKTITLQGTENNRRLFGGLWHLDSRIITSLPGTPGTPAVTKPFNQLIKNGDFSDGTNDWYTLYSTITASDNELTITKTKASYGGFARVAGTWTIYTSHKYYISCYAKTNTPGVAAAFGFFNNSSISGNTIFTTTSSTYTQLHGIVSPVATTHRLSMRAGTSSSAIGSNCSFMKVQCTDLTELYGAGNEPTLAEFETEFYSDTDFYDYVPVGGEIIIVPAVPPGPDITGDIGIFFNPMKRVPFLLYVDEMVVERGYCQLTAINRTRKDYTFSLSLYGGLGEFFYNLQTDAAGESRKLSDLDFGSDLGFTINAQKVQAVWDALLGGTFPDVAFVPMLNGVPEKVAADKMLIKNSGLPDSLTDGGKTYTAKDGYLLASLERKVTEWECHDLRSYLQRPALRLKTFLDAICNPANNGGWAVNLDPGFFNADNPYYNNSYILLPQLNTEETTEEICDDGSVGAVDIQPATSTRTQDLVPASECLPLSGNYIDMAEYASNAYLKISLPVQLTCEGLSDMGNLYLVNRVSHHTENKTVCVMLAAYDETGNLLAVSNRYVFTSKSHRNETGDVKKPAAPLATTDAQIDGYFTYSGGRYVFRLDENSSDTFALTIDKIARPSSPLHRVRLQILVQETAEGIPTLNLGRYGYNIGNVNISPGQLHILGLAGSNNSLSLTAPTQYATDSAVTQAALLNALDLSPLDLLLSVTKTFGLMWLQDNRAQAVSLLQRTAFYTGEINDIHDRIDYSKGVKVRPVSAESNIYTLENEYPETDLSKAYQSDYGRTYGGIRLSVGYEFGETAVELMEKNELKGYVDGALSGAGYWDFTNSAGHLPSSIADGMKVTYYHTEGGETTTKDAEYNLFNVTAVTKYNSPALGVACLNDDGEEKAVEVAPALVLFGGGQLGGQNFLSDDITAMETLNGGPCWIWDNSRTPARIPQFRRVETINGVTYSLDFGTPKMAYYIPEVSLAPDQAVYCRFWEKYLTDFLSRDTKKAECYVVFPPHLDMRQEMRKFYLFDRTLWVLNKVTDYDATKTQSVKCEFIRVSNSANYLNY